MDLSIVATLYCSTPHLKEFYDRVRATAAKVAGEFEIVLVNDGSPDCSLEVALRLQTDDPRVVVVDLARNFGHHKAMMTGLAHARGKRVFLIDCDLEEEPEWLEEFFHILDREGCDVVFGIQEARKGGLIERLSGNAFYAVLNSLTGIDFPRNVVTARLMSRRYVDSLLQYREREVFLAGLWHITGYAQTPVTVKKHTTSPTTYSTSKKLSILVNAVTSFSNRPLRYIFYIGSLISVLSALYIFYLLTRKIVFDIPVDGWTSLIVSLWFLGGLNILFIGVVGIYVSKIFIETKDRPYATIRAVHRVSEPDDG